METFKRQVQPELPSVRDSEKGNVCVESNKILQTNGEIRQVKDFAIKFITEYRELREKIEEKRERVAELTDDIIRWTLVTAFSAAWVTLSTQLFTKYFVGGSILIYTGIIIKKGLKQRKEEKEIEKLENKEREMLSTLKKNDHYNIIFEAENLIEEGIPIEQAVEKALNKHISKR
jgi:hypothetical protein